MKFKATLSDWLIQLKVLPSQDRVLNQTAMQNGKQMLYLL
jgi:hypothetical protein